MSVRTQYLTQIAGPVVADLRPAAPPSSLDWFEVSHDAAVDGVLQLNCSLSIAAGTSFSSVKIYLTGFKGNATPVALAQSAEFSFSMQLPVTGETVTVTALVINSSGVEQTFGTALSTTITLSGPATKPCRLSNIFISEGLNSTEVIFNVSPESSVTSYRLYRAASGQPFSAASLIVTLTATQGSGIFSISDPTKGSYTWYITAVNASGESTPSLGIAPLVPYGSGTPRF